ncbi:hypothetical protein [Pseudomonas sp. NPDC089758]|uniref:hypothetical protein n=1 Tax=Pseudomonas sp. NPDC089758 TaxID=3364473 RepID=UPI00381E64D1
MSKLTALNAEAQAGLSIQERIPEEKWAAIAAQCGAVEVAEIMERIARLKPNSKPLKIGIVTLGMTFMRLSTAFPNY